eukprot:gene57673-biopygen6090
MHSERDEANWREITGFLSKSEMEKWADTLWDHGFDSMRRLRRAGKVDLVEVGMPLGHALELLEALEAAGK